MARLTVFCSPEICNEYLLGFVLYGVNFQTQLGGTVALNCGVQLRLDFTSHILSV
jgi:hypothetical protein